MKPPKKLIDIVQRLEKADLVRYATNIGMEVEKRMNVKKLREAYTEYILSHPRELLIQLPKGDLELLKRVRNAASPAEACVYDLHVLPIMVLYGLADAESPNEDIVGIALPEDLCDAFFPHIDWALGDENNKIRMSVEIAVDGLANVLGFVTQEQIINQMKEITGLEDAGKARQLLNTVRQYSLLLDSMEWAEDMATASDEDLLFVSRLGWNDTSKMIQYIETICNNIPKAPEFDISDIAVASGAALPIIPNERGRDFKHFLMSDLGFDETQALIICFNLWYLRTRRGEYGDNDEAVELYFLTNVLGVMAKEPTDGQAEEAMRRMADYVDHLPLWSRAGHTAAEYPEEAFVRKLTAKPLGPMIRKVRKEARLMADILNQEPLPPSKKVGRNDPCPCGSGRKYKHCCGRG